MTGKQWASLTKAERALLIYVLCVQDTDFVADALPFIKSEKILAALANPSHGLNAKWVRHMIAKLIRNY